MGSGSGKEGRSGEAGTKSRVAEQRLRVPGLWSCSSGQASRWTALCMPCVWLAELKGPLPQSPLPLLLTLGFAGEAWIVPQPMGTLGLEVALQNAS